MRSRRRLENRNKRAIKGKFSDTPRLSCRSRAGVTTKTTTTPASSGGAVIRSGRWLWLLIEFGWLVGRTSCVGAPRGAQLRRPAMSVSGRPATTMETLIISAASHWPSSSSWSPSAGKQTETANGTSALNSDHFAPIECNCSILMASSSSSSCVFPFARLGV